MEEIKNLINQLVDFSKQKKVSDENFFIFLEVFCILKVYCLLIQKELCRLSMRCLCSHLL
jgi:hypothetical protein